MIEFGDRRLPSRFWDKVHPEPNCGCWLWSGAFAPGGYGQFWLGKLQRATRLLMELDHGTLRRDEYVLHKCDNPPCCNPDHLWVGSQSDNMNDAHGKGRYPPTKRKSAFCRRGHAKTPEIMRRGECHECRKYRQRIEYLKKEHV